MRRGGTGVRLRFGSLVPLLNTCFELNEVAHVKEPKGKPQETPNQTYQNENPSLLRGNGLEGEVRTQIQLLVLRRVYFVEWQEVQPLSPCFSSQLPPAGCPIPFPPPISMHFCAVLLFNPPPPSPWSTHPFTELSWLRHYQTSP